MIAWLLGGLIGCALGIAGTIVWLRLSRGRATALREPEVRNVARGLAHEIRNPLNAMSITLQLLEEDLDAGRVPDREELRDQIGRIRGEVGRLERILTDFQRYARLMQAQPEPIDPAQLLHELLDFMEPEAERVGVEIVREIGPLPTIEADPALLRQAFLNLIVNAFQAMPDGGRLTVRATVSSSEVRITFADTGPGIAPETVERIFEPFYSTKKDGTGLGLAVVKQVVELHRGRVDVESEPGHGATFLVALPVDGSEGSGG